jgi:hypothetical protein
MEGSFLVDTTAPSTLARNIMGKAEGRRPKAA